MKKNLLTLSLFVLLAMATGCSKTNTSAPETSGTVNPNVHDVAGWCIEHEVSEAVCALCNPKVAEECKKNGDWCEEHNRPESQCFLCDPSRKEKFVAQYEAQHGKKPPVAEKH
ncbi:MAG: hypothetical protein LBJ67_02530 [Planctomycetaceae bacterium]|jgi:hypothetical protein|nr:hypothetical protein [Planctomycetaceae bacterium]